MHVKQWLRRETEPSSLPFHSIASAGSPVSFKLQRGRKREIEEQSRVYRKAWGGAAGVHHYHHAVYTTEEPISGRAHEPSSEAHSRGNARRLIQAWTFLHSLRASVCFAVSINQLSLLDPSTSHAHHNQSPHPHRPPQTSAISLNRRIVLLVAAAAGVLHTKKPPISIQSSNIPRYIQNHLKRPLSPKHLFNSSPSQKQIDSCTDRQTNKKTSNHRQNRERQLTKPSTLPQRPSSCSSCSSRCRRCAA